jgi:hypothetical protein
MPSGGRGMLCRMYIYARFDLIFFFFWQGLRPCTPLLGHKVHVHADYRRIDRSRENQTHLKIPWILVHGSQS